MTDAITKKGFIMNNDNLIRRLEIVADEMESLMRFPMEATVREAIKILKNHSSERSVNTLVRNASGAASDEQELPKCPICGGILKWDNKVGSDLRETEPNNYYDIKCTTNGCYLEYGADWFHAKDTIIEKLNVRV